mgnify:CR=1 FL=1
MTTRRISLAIAALLALALPTAATAAPTAVDVRVEGRTATLWSGSVITDGKVVTPANGGSHLCDGTNFGANPTPGPTPTTALSDAAIKGGFTWDATWFGPGFPDYAVDRVGPDAATDSEFWGVFVNGVAPDVGGCQVLLKAGDEALWAFDAFSKTGALALSAPETAIVDEPVVVRATAVADGAPVAGATVRGVATGADGRATLTFAEPGVYTLKADKPDMVRSRPAQLCVDPPLADPCSSGDKTAPTAVLEAPAISSSTARFDWVRLSWLGDDGDGSGIRRYTVQQRRIDRPDQPWRAVVTDSALTEKRFRGREGGAYEVRVQAFDRASNGSSWVTATTLVPFDNLSARVRFSKRGWKALRRHGAFKRSVHRAVRRGASARLRFTGTKATLVTRALPRGGRVRISAGGESRVVSLKGRGRFRTKLVATPELDAGSHVLRITSLGRAPVEVDAIAIHP